jgi:hypothetical protein
MLKCDEKNRPTLHRKAIPLSFSLCKQQSANNYTGYPDVIYSVNAVLPDPESNDFAVLTDNSERDMVINLFDRNSAIDPRIGNIIIF